MAGHVVKLKIKDVYIHPHSGRRGGRPVDDLLAAGIKFHADRWRSLYGIDYKFTVSRTSGFPVVSGPVIIKGQHYRGAAKSGYIILHNAWVPDQNRWSDTFWVKDEKGFIDQVGIILHHECAHYWFRFPSGSHSNDRLDLMHAWVGRELTESRPKMAAKFGILTRTKSQEALAEKRMKKDQMIQLPAIPKTLAKVACNGRCCFPVEI